MPSRPDHHEPRFPGYTSTVPDDVAEIVFLQYGVHARDAGASAAVASAMSTLFVGDNAPDVRDRGAFVDVAGEHNTVWMAYWFDPQRHRSWLDRHDVAEGWASHPDTGEVGVWRETAVIPGPRQETLYSHPPQFAPTSGLSQSFDQQTTPYHDYWGAARDRIADSWRDPLTGQLPGYDAQPWDTRGRRMFVEAPGNLCLIRSAQDWSRAQAFRDVYLRDVAPVKDAGVDYLARTPDTGCITARNIREQDHAGAPLDRSCTIAWFCSLAHLERWSKSHKTHLAIYGSFFQMLGTNPDSPLDVAFWHEVSVPPAGSVHGEYINCHPDCGLLRLGAATAVPLEEVTTR
jgi:phenylacetaldoxime dehydratase/aldoxime dehydratase